MYNTTLHRRRWQFVASLLVWCATSPSFAQTIPPDATRAFPGSADPGRIKIPEATPQPVLAPQAPMELPQAAPDQPIPPNASEIKFVLNKVTIDGATAFTPEELAETYTPYVGKEISLATAYKIAADITRKYRDQGYFLSVARIPNQAIAGGEIHISVIEGYIGQIDSSNPELEHYVIDAYEEALKAEKPVKAESIESFLLRMNDLPGLSFRAILSPFEESTDGAVRLTLIPSHTQATGYISTDNFNSRYLGPYQATASYSTSIMPFQQTSFSGVRSLGQDKLHSVSLTHLIPVWTNTDLELNGAVTNVYPGYTLEPLEIHSRSSELAAAINYHWIRLRQENLSTKLKFDARDTVSHLLGVKTTEDIVRAIRVSVDYDRTDSWQGYNLVDITVSKGIDTLGTQVQNPLELSRAGASPTFTKAEFSLTRLQAITPNWSVLSRAAGQISSGTLYSSEQFGYGGQVFGRAFDASELVGDHGIAGSLELRYDAFSAIEPVGAQPFVFYDAGLVGSHSSSQLAQQTASSTGGGVRLNSIYGQSASITAAFPLGHDAETPLYGADGDGPRFSIQFTQKF